MRIILEILNPSATHFYVPLSRYQDIKAKQFLNPFKRKRVARKIQKLKRKLFCFARRSSAGVNAGAGFGIIRAIFARNRFELRSAIATNILKIKGNFKLKFKSASGIFKH